MAAHIKKDLYPSAVIATDTTTVGETFHLHAHAQELVLISSVSARTDGTFTSTLQHSPDGVNWYTLVAAAAQSADGVILATVASTVSILPYVRVSILSASTTSGATVEVDLYHGVQR